ncbi:MAG: RNA methyltransferase [Thermodesulfobacteriota bacterium]
MKNISIVLVAPQSAGNIGSTARVMKNTGFRRLCLVNPVEYANDDGFSMACNAVDILREARVFSSLAEAVKKSGMVAGVTRREGKVRNPLLPLDGAVAQILKFSEKNEVSLVFGREDKGLKNDEIALCDTLIEIPSHPDYPSLNLSHAVFALCYGLFTGGRGAAPQEREAPEGGPIDAAPHEERKKLYAHLESTLRELGYGEEHNRKSGESLLRSIMKNFRRLFGRSGLTQKEVNMLRGICTRIEDNVEGE